MPVLGSGGSGGTGSGLPTGGATNQILRKNSATDGDATWVTPATVDHLNVPLASSGAGTPGALTTAAPIDHVHPASNGGGAGGVDSFMASVPATTASGDVYAIGGGSASAAMFQRGQGYPCRVSASGTFLVGVEVTAAVASSFVRISIFTDSTRGLPGVLVYDSGQLASVANGFLYGASATLTVGTRYWFFATQEGGASSINLRASRVAAPYSIGTVSNQTYAGTSVRLGAGPYASNPTVIAIDELVPFTFLLKAP